MNAESWLALLGSIAVGVLIRVSNMLVAWLARVLGVKPPDPIPVPSDESDDGRQRR